MSDVSPPIEFNIDGSLDLSEWLKAYHAGELDTTLVPTLRAWLGARGQAHLMEAE